MGQYFGEFSRVAVVNLLLEVFDRCQILSLDVGILTLSPGYFMKMFQQNYFI